VIRVRDSVNGCSFEHVGVVSRGMRRSMKSGPCCSMGFQAGGSFMACGVTRQGARQRLPAVIVPGC